MKFAHGKTIAAAVAVFACAAASADSGFPQRRIQVIYPWSAGTPTYAVSQIIANAMAKQLGVNIPVVAKTGAGGVNAFNQALNQPADGYTMLDGYVAPLIISPLFKKANWSCSSFVPLYSATSNVFAIASLKSEARWTNFPSFVKYLKAHPGKTLYGAAPLSLPNMVVSKMLKSLNLVARDVPYSDPANSIKDLRGGLLSWVVINPGIYRADKGSLRVLAVLSSNPQARKIYGGAKLVTDFGAHIGLTGLAPSGWDWWLVKKGTPQSAVGKLRGAMRAALSEPGVRKKINQIGFVVTEYSPSKYENVCTSVKKQLESGIAAIKWEKQQLKKLGY